MTAPEVLRSRLRQPLPTFCFSTRPPQNSFNKVQCVTPKSLLLPAGLGSLRQFDRLFASVLQSLVQHHTHIAPRYGAFELQTIDEHGRCRLYSQRFGFLHECIELFARLRLHALSQSRDIDAVLLSEIKRDLVDFSQLVSQGPLIPADRLGVSGHIVGKLPICASALSRQAARVDGRASRPRMNLEQRV